MLEDVFHYYSILSCIPIDCSLTNISSCWPGLGSLLRRNVNPCLKIVVLHSDWTLVMVSARGCPASTCISPVWLERCKISLSSLAGIDVIYLSIYLFVTLSLLIRN